MKGDTELKSQAKKRTKKLRDKLEEAKVDKIAPIIAATASTIAQPKRILKISQWNVNGIRAIIRKGDFGTFMRTVNPGIMCMNEIKVCDQKVIQEDLAGKLEPWFPKNRLFWSCCQPPKTGYAGTAIFVNREWQDELSPV